MNKITNEGTNQVLRYDGTTGAYLGVFADGGVMNAPLSLRGEHSSLRPPTSGHDGLFNTAHWAQETLSQSTIVSRMRETLRMWRLCRVG